MSKIHLQFLAWTVETIDMPGNRTEVVLEMSSETHQTVRQVLRDLADRYPLFNHKIYDARDNHLSDWVNLFINGQMLESAGGLDATLKDGDVLSFLPVVEGG